MSQAEWRAIIGTIIRERAGNFPRERIVLEQ